MNFNNIPVELKLIPNWICWRLEERGTAKPTKPPYQTNGFSASVTNPAHWSTFEQAVAAFNNPTNNFTGIGFVFQKKLGYVAVDMDDTHGDEIAFAGQLNLYMKLNSYSELSPSGKGVHIIVKADIPIGRRRDGIEIYDDGRYFTMTGDVHNNVPIAGGVEVQETITTLFNQMGGKPNILKIIADKEQKHSDEEVLKQCNDAVNGEKFHDLFVGNWQKYYASQSEADLAAINIICFYSRNKIQIKRIFRTSMLGQRDKAKRDDYLDYMIEKSFDNMLKPVDILGLKINGESFGATAEPGGTAVAPSHAAERGASTGKVEPLSHVQPSGVNPFPPGLLGEIAQFFLDQAPRQVPDIALAGAIAFMAGICGRAYNISGTGLNQYVLMLAQTGVGKDAVADGIAKLTAAVQTQVPSIIDFKGPGELVSAPGLIKWLDKKSCMLSIVGEFGKKLQEMASDRASPHLQGLSRALLQMYSKSGNGSVFDPMAYSDREKNTGTIQSPSLTIFGESVPDNFYDSLDESLISDGLLPRFLIFEYKGERAYLNKNASTVVPSFSLIQSVCNLVANVLSTNTQHQKVNHVQSLPEALIRINDFDTWTTDTMNTSDGEVYRHLWNRAHLKAHKLAALRAVGMNYLEPIITLEEINWAIDIVVDQTRKLIAKFDTGQIGQSGGGENKQLTHMVKTISQFLHNPFDVYSKYGGVFEMHRDGVITEAHISRRLIGVSCYRNDRQGPTMAIKRVIKTLLDADDIREIPRSQMQATYGKGPRAFAISSPELFKPERKKK